MPASPTCPTVAEFRALVVSLDSAACDQLRKLARLSATVATAYECIYDADGNFTDQFKAKLCQTGCVNGGGGGGGVTPPGGGGVTPPSGGLDPVTGLVIRAAANHIEVGESYRLTWNVLSNATSYTVLRNTVSSVTTATLLAYKAVPDVSESVDRLYANQTNGQGVRMYRDGLRVLFVDTPASTASNVEYFYWVQAHGASDTYSSVSAPVSARRRRPIGQFVGSHYPAQTTFDVGSAANMIQTVPPLAILATVTLEGGGGGGAGATMGVPGGGGGRGSFVCVEMPVVGGNQVKVICDVDAKGAAGVSGGNGGSGADAVLYFRSSSAVETWTEMARAFGGGGGMYSAGGSGAGGLAGAAPTTSVDPAAPTVTVVQAYAGFPGGPASGITGGYAGGGTFEHRRKRAERFGFYAQNTLPAVPGGGADAAGDSSQIQEPFSAGCAGGEARATLAFMAAGFEVLPSGGYTAEHTLDIEQTVDLPAISGGATVRYNVIGGGGGGGSRVSGTTPGTCAGTRLEGIASGGGSGELRFGRVAVSGSAMQLHVKFNAPIPSGVAGSGATGGAVELTHGIFTPVATAAGGGGGLQGCCDSGNLLGGAAGAGGSSVSVLDDPNDLWMAGLVGATALGGNVCSPTAAGGTARSLGAGAGGVGNTNNLTNAGGKGRAVFTW